MPNKNNAHPTDLEDMPDETEELPFDLEDMPDETEELPFDLEDMPEFEFLLRTKSREFILETLPKVQESNKCGPDKALYILARSMGFTPKFLQDEKDITQLRRTLPTLNLNFPSKSSLSNYLALEKGLSFCFRHNDQTDELIIDIPGLTGELKTARFENRFTMQMQGGRHVYYLNPNTTKVVNINRKKVTQFIERKIRAAMKENWYGFDKVTMVYHTPIGRINHFLQSILPQAKIKSRYGTAILATSTKKIKEGRFALQIKGITAPKIQIQHVSTNNQNVYLVTFSTTARYFMEKIVIIHAFVSRIISENAYLTRQMHRFVQVEHGEGSAKKHLFPFTIYVEPFSFKDYYFSKFRNVHTLFFSFPKEMGKH